MCMLLKGIDPLDLVRLSLWLCTRPQKKDKKKKKDKDKKAKKEKANINDQCSNPTPSIL